MDDSVIVDSEIVSGEWHIRNEYPSGQILAVDILKCEWDKELYGNELHYTRIGDSAFDGRAAEDTVLLPFKPQLVSLGIKFQLRPDQEVLLMSRSGIPYKHSVIIGNSVGLIDSNYTGDVKACLIALDQPFEIKRGDRICQLKPQLKPCSFEMQHVIVENNTNRGDKGFGSSGVK